jgi:hypothetical protein
MNNKSNELIRDDEITRNKFFECIINENVTEIVKYFRNESIEVWTFREQDDYTGMKNS